MKGNAYLLLYSLCKAYRLVHAVVLALLSALINRIEVRLSNGPP